MTDEKKYSLYTSPEAEAHLQKAFNEARGHFVPQNIADFEEILKTPTTRLGKNIHRSSSTWSATAISWLLQDVFGWQDLNYLFIRSDDELPGDDLALGTYLDYAGGVHA